MDAQDLQIDPRFLWVDTRCTERSRNDNVGRIVNNAWYRWICGGTIFLLLSNAVKGGLPLLRYDRSLKDAQGLQ